MLKEPSNPSPGKGIGSSLPSSVSGGSGISSGGGLSEPSLPILLIRPRIYLLKLCCNHSWTIPFCYEHNT